MFLAYADSDLLSLLDLVGRSVFHSLLPSPLDLYVLTLKSGFFDLVLDDIADIVSKNVDGVLLLAVVTEVVDLTDPLVLDVLSRIVCITAHGTKSDSPVIVVLDNKAVLLVTWVLLDALDSIEVRGESDGIVMVVLEDGECPVVEDSTDREPRALALDAEVFSHPVKIALLDDTGLSPLVSLGSLNNLQSGSFDSNLDLSLARSGGVLDVVHRWLALVCVAWLRENGTTGAWSAGALWLNTVSLKERYTAVTG